MRTIEVKSCGECPFLKGISWDYCGINKSIYQEFLPRESVHENCPLKTESVTVKLKEE